MFVLIIFVLGIFLLMLQQLDVFMQLLFSFVPIILSIIVSTLINRDKDPEKDNYLQCAAICAGFNFISLVVEYICITAVTGANDIYEVSQKYNSEYVTVSENNSPIFSIIVFSIVSFALHYFVRKKQAIRKANMPTGNFDPGRNSSAGFFICLQNHHRMI